MVELSQTDSSSSSSFILTSRIAEDLFRLRSSSSTSADVPFSSEFRILVSRPMKYDLGSFVSILSSFGEVQCIDVSRLQFDSTISVSYFDVRAAVLAQSQVSRGKCPGLSMAGRSRAGSASGIPHCATLSARSVDVIGFESSAGQLECQELMLSVFGRFGEVESINMIGDGRFSLAFFDSRSSLAVQAALTTNFGDDGTPQFTEQVVVSADQLLQLLLIGTATVSENVTPPQPVCLVRSPPSKDFDRSRSSAAASSEFAINLRHIEKGSDTRTTVMVRNIPKTFSQTFFLSILETKFPTGTFDFVYLPMDLMNGVNVGYAFVNFQDSQTIIPFFNFFNNKTWRTILHTLDISGARAFEPDISNRSCKVTYARIQGLDQLDEHFRSSSIMNQPDSIRPYFHNDSE